MICPLCNFKYLVKHSEHYCSSIIPGIGRRIFVYSTKKELADISYIHEDKFIFDLHSEDKVLYLTDKIASYKFNARKYKNFDYKKYEYFIDVVNELLLFE